jgi:hypothetical protein
VQRSLGQGETTLTTELEDCHHGAVPGKRQGRSPSTPMRSDISTAVPVTGRLSLKCSIAVFPKLGSEKWEHRFLLLQCHAPPQELLLHLLVYHWV